MRAQPNNPEQRNVISASQNKFDLAEITRWLKSLFSFDDLLSPYLQYGSLDRYFEVTSFSKPSFAWVRKTRSLSEEQRFYLIVRRSEVLQEHV